MPTFTGIPVDVAPSPPAPPYLWFNYENNHNGPFHYSGNLYLPGLVPSGTPNYQVAKSTDGGVTWTLFGSGATNIGTYIGAILDEANDEIVMFGCTGSTVKVVYFDLLSETFSSVSTLSTGTLRTLQLSLLQRPDGDIICVYSVTSVGLKAVTVSSGGVFGSPILIEAAPGGSDFRARNAVSDVSNKTHILYWKGSSPRTLRYNTLDSAYSVGAPSQAVASGDPYSFFQFGDPLIWSGKIVAVDQVSDPCRILVGDPYSSPSWAFHDVHTVVTDLPDTYATIVDYDTFLRIFYVSKGFTTEDVFQVMSVDWDGSTFTAPAVWWDVIADPPVGTAGIDPADFEVFGITAELNPNTGATEVAIIVTVDEFDNFQSIVFARIAGGGGSVEPSSIDSDEAWGTPSLSASQITSGSIDSGEAWGFPRVGAVQIRPTGIPTAEAWGRATVGTSGGTGSRMGLS